MQILGKFWWHYILANPSLKNALCICDPRVHACMRMWETDVCCLPPPYFLSKQNFSLNLKFTNCLDRLLANPPQQLRLQVCMAAPAFYIGIRGLNLCPYACVQQILFQVNHSVAVQKQMLFVHIAYKTSNHRITYFKCARYSYINPNLRQII